MSAIPRIGASVNPLMPETVPCPDLHPAQVDLLDGVIPVSAGQTADLTVDLSQDRYVWVSHASKEKGMMKTFTVE